MTKFFKTIIVMALLAAAAPAGASAAPDPVACTGYSTPRVFLEAQEWWKAIPGGAQPNTDFGHVHSGTCFPYLQTISGVQQFDVRTLLHDNPGTLITVRIQTFNDAEGTITRVERPLSLTCAVSSCTFWNTLNVDTTRFAYNGLYEFRVHSEVREPDGKLALATTGWLATVSNPGKPTRNTSYLAPQTTEGRGWYGSCHSCPGDLGYVNARLRSRVPMTPVSGVWQPTVETLPGAFFSSPLAVHHSLVTLDPDFHAVPANQGTVLRDVNGPISPTTLSIDTTQLADGPHKLVIVASHNHLDLGSTQSGVQVIPFTVANGTPPPPPPSLVEKAQGRPATASSTEDPSLAPANGNDGNASTRWASSYADGQWWQVDLGSSQSLSRVTVNWEAAYCSSYHVAVSPDASTWTTVVTATRTASGLATHDFPAASGRYLRLTCDQRATQWGSSFWELKAYG